MLLENRVRLESLEIQNVRVIEHLKLEPSRNVNWILGGNGAGKTSLLESIFLLGRGRSFRGSRQGPLLREGTKGLKIVGRLANGQAPVKMELIAGPKKKCLYENGKVVRRLRDLRQKIHIRVVAENSQRLLEEGPEARRRFLDWNLFHVEPGYWDIHSRFQNVLSQRNAWLRGGAKGPSVWDEEYVELSLQLTAFRQAYLRLLCRHLLAIADSFPFFPHTTLRLRPGWPPGSSLSDSLTYCGSQDRKRGFTQYGPTRADFALESAAFRGTGSRGQCKLLVCMLQFAAEQILEENECGSCVWLLDDLAAELDVPTASNLWSLILSGRGQVFATARNEAQLSECSAGPNRGVMFHVKRGTLQPSLTEFRNPPVSLGP